MFGATTRSGGGGGCATNHQRMLLSHLNQFAIVVQHRIRVPLLSVYVDVRVRGVHF